MCDSSAFGSFMYVTGKVLLCWIHPPSARTHATKGKRDGVLAHNVHEVKVFNSQGGLHWTHWACYCKISIKISTVKSQRNVCLLRCWLEPSQQASKWVDTIFVMYPEFLDSIPTTTHRVFCNLSAERVVCLVCQFQQLRMMQQTKCVFSRQSLSGKGILNCAKNKLSDYCNP